MKQTADLYIRVSTDEQADKGYSQRNQEEVLQRHCRTNNISVRKVIYEDHSAKTFMRPEWIKYLEHLKRHKGQSDLVLFTKWDRFSRNAPDSYQMIAQLRKLGVEPQAIEQPLDLSVPENKMMLAIYLSTPEIENDRRALNVIYGMRRAKKEGRWMSAAPIGYANKTTESGVKYVAPKYPEATIVKWIFETLAEGLYASDQVRKMAITKGLKCSKNNFYNCIRNPIYCGKIFIPKYKDEESCTVQGKHEAIVSETLFYAVQDILEGKRRGDKKRGTTIVCDERLPLRGFLICPKCGLMLSGSASKGRNAYYYYYHCNSTCGCRYKADTVNELFVKEIEKFVPDSTILELYKEIILQEYANQTKNRKDEKKAILAEIDKQNAMLTNARKLLMANEIESVDYREMKAECEQTINRLESKLSDNSDKTDKVDTVIDQAMHNLSHLNVLYENGDIQQKRLIIGSMYPENLTFDGIQHRTTRLNEAMRWIYNVDKAFSENKNGKQADFLHVSRLVAGTGIEPVFAP